MGLLGNLIDWLGSCCGYGNFDNPVHPVYTCSILFRAFTREIAIGGGNGGGGNVGGRSQLY